MMNQARVLKLQEFSNNQIMSLYQKQQIDSTKQKTLEKLKIFKKVMKQNIQLQNTNVIILSH